MRAASSTASAAIGAIAAIAVIAMVGATWVSEAGAQSVAGNAAVYSYKGADRAQRLLDGARREGGVNLYTSMAPTEIGPLAEAFEKKTGVKVNLWRALSEGVAQRALAEARGRRQAMDVVETNGPEVEALAREQVLAAFHSPHLADLPPASLPRHGMWAADRLSFFVVAFNTNKVRAADLPKSYEGFLDPKWKGRLAMEATDSEWMAGVVKTWGEPRGMDFMRKLGAMKPEMRKGHVLLAQLIASGEIEVGLTAYHANAQSFKARGAPLDWAPVEPVIARPQGIGVAANAPHPHAALLFVDFMLSPEAQELLAKMGRSPASRAVKTDTSSLNFVMSDAAVILDENDKWQQLWDKLFMAK